MARIVRTLPARNDLLQIWIYIAQENPSAADRMIDRFEQALKLLALNPLMGHSADRFRAGLRQFTVGRYILFYEPIDDGIRVVRVLHGSRRLEELL